MIGFSQQVAVGVDSPPGRIGSTSIFSAARSLKATRTPHSSQINMRLPPIF
jgi:hypothetical protein